MGFTSGTKSVMSCVHVLCEGRCALVTSFAAYRFYITYGLNWSVVKTINFAYGVRMPITAYLTIDSICSWLCAWAITGALPLDRVLKKYRPTSSLFSGNIFISCVLPWLMWMGIMTIMLLKVMSEHPDHTVMPPVLTKGVGYWELGDTWESTIFTFFQVCPLIWCGVCYSLGTKFRKSLFTNTSMLSVWGVIFVFYSTALLIEPGKFSGFFHIASNAHNGINTESPVWMRYQMPLGCPSRQNDTALYDPTQCRKSGVNDETGAVQYGDCNSVEYREAIGLGSWREELPSEETCAKILMSVNKCKGACDSWYPGVPSPGMPMDIRTTLFGCVLAGMAFMMLTEMVCNAIYIKECDWINDGSVTEAAIDDVIINSVSNGNGKNVATTQV